MLIGLSLLIMITLTFLSVILGESFIGSTVNVGIDNTALVNGSTSTYFVEAQDLLFQIDTSSLIIAGIILISTIIAVASITGIQVLGSGLNTQSVRVIIIATSFIGLWASLSILAFNLISRIQVFGGLIYIGITIAYSIGVIQKISGGNSE